MLPRLLGADAAMPDPLDVGPERRLDLAALPGNGFDGHSRQLDSQLASLGLHLLGLPQQGHAGQTLPGGDRRRLHGARLGAFGQDDVAARLAGPRVDALAEIHGEGTTLAHLGQALTAVEGL